MGVRKRDEGKGQEDLRLKILKSHIEAFIFFFSSSFPIPIRCLPYYISVLPIAPRPYGNATASIEVRCVRTFRGEGVEYHYVVWVQQCMQLMHTGK